MAAKQKVNKSEVIRKAIIGFPDWQNKEIAAYCRKQHKGVEFSPGIVAAVRSNLKKKMGEKSNGKIDVIVPSKKKRTKVEEKSEVGLIPAAILFLDECGDEDLAFKVLNAAIDIRNVLEARKDG